MSTELKSMELKLVIESLFSTRKLAEFFDCMMADGSPATSTIIEWWHMGKIPQPDLILSKKAIYWKPDTIKNFVENGGLC